MNKARRKTPVNKGESAASRMLKSWGKNRDQAPAIHIRPERILIVTEGTKTEPYYFEGFRKRINDSFEGEYITVEVIGMGENTVSLFNSARHLAEKSFEGYTQVWVVYDKDSFPARDFNAIEDLCRAASGNGVSYKAAWTNESFELWFLLHFCFVDSALDRASIPRRLSRHLAKAGHGKYQKARSDMFDLLRPYMGFAISNAKRLEEANKGKTPSQSNPGTTVHHLVNELAPYLEAGQSDEGSTV